MAVEIHDMQGYLYARWPRQSMELKHKVRGLTKADRLMQKEKNQRQTGIQKSFAGIKKHDLIITKERNPHSNNQPNITKFWDKHFISNIGPAPI